MEAPAYILLPGDIPLSMIKVQGDTFSFGKTEDQLGHEVRVTDFQMGQFPITNHQYAAFLQSYQSDKVKDGAFAGQLLIYEHRWGLQKRQDSWIPAIEFNRNPVINVTWYGANEFCNWLSKNTDGKYSLPSETQWEYAARGGRYSLGFSYAGGNKLKEVGWYRHNSHQETKEIGLKLPNELGLHDMSGNVWEWCLDHYQSERRQIPQDGSPWLGAKKKPNSNAYRVVRGGSWYDGDFNCRVSTRFNSQAGSRGSSIGFRVVRY